MLVLVLAPSKALPQSSEDKAALAEAARLNQEAVALYRAGRYAQAVPLMQRSLAIREKALGPEHPDVATSLNNLAELYRAQGQYAQAEPLYRRSLAIREKALGPEHPDVATSLNNLAYFLAGRGQTANARPLYEKARRILLAVSRANIDLDEEAHRSLLKQQSGGLYVYAGLLATIARDPSLDPSGSPAVLDAFFVVEQMRGGAAQAALARAGARAAAGDAATAQLARQVQELRDRRQAVRKQLTDEYGKPTAQRNAMRLGALQQQAQQVDRDLAEASDRLLKAFPKYAELTAPDPIDPPAVGPLLRRDEALMSFFTLDDRVLVWLLRAGQVPVYRDVEIKRAELAKLIERVRKSLDQSVNPDLATGRLLPFDVAGGHEVYKLLLAPLRVQLAGVKHLLIVPDQVLLPLPFGVLVTSVEGEPYKTLAELYEKKLSPAPRDLAEYGKLSWLAREFAITVLPSATSLRALRQIAQAKGTAVEPFIGFGDPVLRGGGRTRGGAMLASRGPGVALEELRKMNRLPGTREELKAVATVLGADPTKALYLDKEATKPTVFRLNTAGRLGQAQVLAFATHGLLAGDLKGLTQPALVLTPPAMPSEQDDGLLALEDILGLKLTSTDWVILSACNTAAGDGSGEGLAGLARAFFFAGARSLLVFHWSVEDRATQALMTEVFRRFAADKTMPRAEALRQGMLALMASDQGQTAYFAHPFAWAPFFLVGDGGAN
jgi:CHAT domain-containing protein